MISCVVRVVVCRIPVYVLCNVVYCVMYCIFYCLVCCVICCDSVALWFVGLTDMLRIYVCVV